MLNEIAERVYQMVREIPKGRVTTYGAIAKKLGVGPRQVGQILHKNPSGEVTPCHRVVRSDGKIADGYAFGGEFKQREKLEKEGVVFSRGKILKAFFV